MGPLPLGEAGRLAERAHPPAVVWTRRICEQPGGGVHDENPLPRIIDRYPFWENRRQTGGVEVQHGSARGIKDDHLIVGAVYDGEITRGSDVGNVQNI